MNLTYYFKKGIFPSVENSRQNINNQETRIEKMTSSDTFETSATPINQIESLPDKEFVFALLLEIDRQIEREEALYQSHKETVCSHEEYRFADPNDRASREEASSVCETLLKGVGARIGKLRTARTRIEMALKKNNLDEILFCHGCGTDIQKSRLLAQPTTSWCCDCKTLQEEKTHRFHGSLPGHHMWHAHPRIALIA